MTVHSTNLLDDIWHTKWLASWLVSLVRIICV